MKGKRLLVWFLSSLLIASGIFWLTPSSWSEKATMRITVDNTLVELFINGDRIKVDAGEAGDWTLGSTVEFDTKPGKNAIAANCSDSGVIAGLLVDITVGKTIYVTDDTWKFSLSPGAGWQEVRFDDTKWKKTVKYAQYPQGIWAQRVPLFDKPMTKAFWIWSDVNVQGGKIDTPVFFRFTFGEDLAVSPSSKLATEWGKMKAVR